MSDLGDQALGAAPDWMFTTVNSSGVPTSLAGSPVLSVFKNNSTTPTTAGVTLTPDFAGITGLNHCRVAMSSDPAFYTSGDDYTAILTAGTVGGLSVVGYVAGTWSVENRNMKADVHWWRTALVDPAFAGSIPVNLQRWRDIEPAILLSGLLQVVSIQNQDKLNYTLDSGQPSSIASAVLASVIEPRAGGGSWTLIQLIRGFASALVALCEGMNTVNPKFRSMDGTKFRLSLTADEHGNRQAHIALDLD